jgi:hypothetical protein
MRSERFKVVSVLDEAIDTESIPFDTMQEYIETRDVKLLAQHIKPGMKPVTYHVRAVHHSMWESYVMAGGDHDDIKFRRAFMCGIDRVEDLPSRDGTTITLEPKLKIGAAKVFTEDEVNDRFAPSEVLEIGSVIFHHSFLPLRNTVTWHLPSTCVGPLANRKFRSADASQSPAETTTSEQPSSNTAMTSETASA